MKTKTWISLGVMLAVAGLAVAQTVAPVDAKKAEAKVPAAPVKKDDKKKKADEMGKIDGLVIVRGAGFLGVQIVNGVFKLTSYDAKKKPVAADFTRVALRWPVSYQPNPERTLLTPGGGIGAFTSEKVVKPPHAFKLFITLIKGEAADAPVENLTVDFRG